MPEHVHRIVHPRRDDDGVANIRQPTKEPVSQLAIDDLESQDAEWLVRAESVLLLRPALILHSVRAIRFASDPATPPISTSK